jgi:hypothetical protein
VTPSLFSGYVLDADFIIGLGRRINPLEMRVKAREIVDELSAQARIKSPMEVYFELSNKSKNSGDEVLAWCNSHREIFEDLTESVQFSLATVLATFDGMVKSDMGSFDADPILVAMALDYGWTVVTRDGSGSSPSATGIHVVCEHFDVRCITDYEFLKENGWSV